MRIILLPISIIGKLQHNHRINTSILCIEAGARGWESIEFKELYTSACEYLGQDRVHKVIINRDINYFKQFKNTLKSLRPTHYFYDPRTGSQHGLKALVEAFRISVALSIRNIHAIIILTDPSVRRWRAQSSMVTARQGIVFTSISAKAIAPIFPHRRLVGPSLMPLSAKTLQSLVEMRSSLQQNESHSALFSGSLYEPRTSMLNTMASQLQEKGFKLEIRGRVAGGPRISDEAYWSGIICAPLIVTTADQIISDEYDWTWIPQMVYRYLEVMAAGTLLVAPEVPGLRRYFIPEIHFASFSTVEEAAQVIAYYLTHPKERKILAAKGAERARSLILGRSYWISVDAALGTNSLT